MSDGFHVVTISGMSVGANCPALLSEVSGCSAGFECEVVSIRVPLVL